MTFLTQNKCVEWILKPRWCFLPETEIAMVLMAVDGTLGWLCPKVDGDWTPLEAVRRSWVASEAHAENRDTKLEDGHEPHKASLAFPWPNKEVGDARKVFGISRHM